MRRLAALTLFLLTLGGGPGAAPARADSVAGVAVPEDTPAPRAARPAPTSQPERRFAAFSSEDRARPPRPAIDLELRRAPLEDAPTFRPVRPFVELLAYHAFLVGAGWLYGNSPLDWDEPSWDGWWYNVSHAPVHPDGDVWWLNWSHAVFGSDHYLMARNSGWSWWSAALFCNFGSLTWEYVTEGIFEQPSLVDLISTPILGSLLGEVRYRAYRLVKRSLGDRWYGRVVMGVLDPTTTVFELAGW